MEEYYYEPEGTPPSVMVLCEYSGRVRDAFLDMGWDAYSCDLLPCESDVYDGRHYQMDAMDAMRTRPFWDLIIAHPPCTALAVSGNAWYGNGMPKNHLRHEAIEWTTKLWSEACQHSSSVCLENPVGVLGDWIGKPAQYIQPWQFGHPEQKKTGLWLYGLDPLVETNNVKEEMESLPKCKQQRLHYLSPSEDRAKIRSLTYTGIAEAMAQQWGQWR